MKTRRYSCDGGCIAIGNGSCTIHLPNGFGDGSHRVMVGTKDEMRKTKFGGNRLEFGMEWRWAGIIEGDAINVYDGDCLCGDVADSHILFTLHGRYSIYVNNNSNSGDILIEGGERK